MRRALVVINPIAGPGRARTLGACVDLARTVLAVHDYEADVRVTTGPTDAYRFCERSRRGERRSRRRVGRRRHRQRRRVAVAGTGIPFAIIPGGSGNGLARDLRIPLDPTAGTHDRRDRRRRARSMRAICTARCSSTSPASASMRASPRASPSPARAADWSATSWRPSASCGATSRALFDPQRLRRRRQALVADIIDRPALFIALANSRQYGSGAQIAPRALLDDGMMEIVVVEPQSGLSIMRQVPAFFRGTLREGPGLLMRTAASMEISCPHPIHFHVDGEPRTGPNRISLHDPSRRLVGQGKSLILKAFPAFAQEIVTKNLQRLDTRLGPR